MELTEDIKRRMLEALGELNKNTACLIEHEDELWERYSGQYVGILHGELVGIAPTQFQLALLARRKGLTREEIQKEMLVEFLDPDRVEFFLALVA